MLNASIVTTNTDPTASTPREYRRKKDGGNEKDEEEEEDWGDDGSSDAFLKGGSNVDPFREYPPVYVAGYLVLYGRDGDGELNVSREDVRAALPTASPLPINVDHRRDCTIGSVLALVDDDQGLFFVGKIDCPRLAEVLFGAASEDIFGDAGRSMTDEEKMLYLVANYLPSASLSSRRLAPGERADDTYFAHVALCLLGRRVGTVVTYDSDVKRVIRPFVRLSRGAKNSALLEAADTEQKIVGVRWDPDPKALGRALLGTAVNNMLLKDRWRVVSERRRQAGIEGHKYLQASAKTPFFSLMGSNSAVVVEPSLTSGKKSEETEGGASIEGTDDNCEKAENRHEEAGIGASGGTRAASRRRTRGGAAVPASAAPDEIAAEGSVQIGERGEPGLIRGSRETSVSRVGPSGLEGEGGEGEKKEASCADTNGRRRQLPPPGMSVAAAPFQTGRVVLVSAPGPTVSGQPCVEQTARQLGDRTAIPSTDDFVLIPKSRYNQLLESRSETAPPVFQETSGGGVLLTQAGGDLRQTNNTAVDNNNNSNNLPGQSSSSSVPSSSIVVGPQPAQQIQQPVSVLPFTTATVQPPAVTNMACWGGGGTVATALSAPQQQQQPPACVGTVSAGFPLQGTASMASQMAGVYPQQYGGSNNNNGCQMAPTTTPNFPFYYQQQQQQQPFGQNSVLEEKLNTILDALSAERGAMPPNQSHYRQSPPSWRGNYGSGDPSYYSQPFHAPSPYYQQSHQYPPVPPPSPAVPSHRSGGGRKRPYEPPADSPRGFSSAGAYYPGEAAAGANNAPPAANFQYPYQQQRSRPHFPEDWAQDDDYYRGPKTPRYWNDDYDYEKQRRPPHSQSFHPDDRNDPRGRGGGHGGGDALAGLLGAVSSLQRDVERMKCMGGGVGGNVGLGSTTGGYYHPQYPQGYQQQQQQPGHPPNQIQPVQTTGQFDGNDYHRRDEGTGGRGDGSTKTDGDRDDSSSSVVERGGGGDSIAATGQANTNVGNAPAAAVPPQSSSSSSKKERRGPSARGGRIGGAGDGTSSNPVPGHGATVDASAVQQLVGGRQPRSDSAADIFVEHMMSQR